MNPVYTVKLSDFIEFNDFTDISKNVLPTVQFRKKGDKYLITLINADLHQNSDLNCLVLLNNIPFYDLNYIASLSSEQIEKIEVNEKTMVCGNFNFYGIVSIFTKNKSIIQNSYSVVVDNKVEQPVKIPIKDELQKDSLKIPNFKQDLLWYPDIIFDKNNNTTLYFETSDLKTNYIVDIEGISANGIPFSKKLLFKVK